MYVSVGINAGSSSLRRARPPRSNSRTTSARARSVSGTAGPTGLEIDRADVVGEVAEARGDESGRERRLAGTGRGGQQNRVAPPLDRGRVQQQKGLRCGRNDVWLTRHTRCASANARSGVVRTCRSFSKMRIEMPVGPDALRSTNVNCVATSTGVRNGTYNGQQRVGAPVGRGTPKSKPRQLKVALTLRPSIRDRSRRAHPALDVAPFPLPEIGAIGHEQRGRVLARGRKPCSAHTPAAICVA